MAAAGSALARDGGVASRMAVLLVVTLLCLPTGAEAMGSQEALFAIKGLEDQLTAFELHYASEHRRLTNAIHEDELEIHDQLRMLKYYSPELRNCYPEPYATQLRASVQQTLRDNMAIQEKLDRMHETHNMMKEELKARIRMVKAFNEMSDNSMMW